MDLIDKYTYRIQWSEEDDAFLASCLEFPSIMTHGDSQSDAIDELKIVLKVVIDDISEKKKEAPIPIKERQFKGNISLRIPPETHEELFYHANEQDLSLNQYITTILEKNLYENKIGETVSELKGIIANLSLEMTSLRMMNEEMFSTLYSNRRSFTEESNTAIPSPYLVSDNDEIAI
ncbi:MAG: toxin-antitoxin system HicB family antitoxin [Spirochaetia bacterium]|nr:toxin-antitoxin system HicB family antitoxin [Spirochaetia bacterium]